MPDLPGIPESPNKNARQVVAPHSLPVLREAPPSVADLPIVRGNAPVVVNQPPDATTSAPQPLAQLPPAPAPVASPAQAPTLPQVPPTAPVTPQDSPRVRDRIHTLYGRWKGAEENSNKYLQEIESLKAEVASLRRPAPQVQGYEYSGPVQPSDFPAPGQPQSTYPSAGITREELRVELAEWTRQQDTRNAQIESRLAAERDYPDVFANPDLRASVDEIISLDPNLQNDPLGPVKAALIVRGLNGSPQTSAVDDARRTALGGPGATVPEGNSQAASPEDLSAQYNEALRVASVTQKQEDWARVFALRRQAPR
jgi:hypothetical protein